jgi:hypothetical protein
MPGLIKSCKVKDFAADSTQRKIGRCRSGSEMTEICPSLTAALDVFSPGFHANVSANTNSPWGNVDITADSAADFHRFAS